MEACLGMFDIEAHGLGCLYLQKVRLFLLCSVFSFNAYF